MRLVPKENAAKIQFFQSHIEAWLDNASVLGTSTEAVDDLAAKTQAAFDALKTQRMAQNAAQAATHDLNLAIEAMGTAGASIIKMIRATGEMKGNHIYPLALIPPPADASPIAAPGKPERFEMSLDQNGVVTLTWKCKNPKGSSGTMYKVQRKIGNGAYEYLGQVGEKKFVDQTIPIGTETAIYRVQAVRSTGVGPISNYMVSFGVSEAIKDMLQHAFQVKSAA